MGAARWKADGLDATGLQMRVGASSLTLGGPRAVASDWDGAVERSWARIRAAQEDQTPGSA